MADQLATSLTIEQAATLVGVDRTRVAHRIRQRELDALWLGRQQRLPRWQFQVATTTTRSPTGLASVLELLPDGHLLAAIDTLARARHRVLAGPWLPPPRTDPWWSHSMSLIEQADSGERPTGAQWSTLTANLGAVEKPHLRQRDWDMPLRRCTPRGRTADRARVRPAGRGDGSDRRPPPRL